MRWGCRSQRSPGGNWVDRSQRSRRSAACSTWPTLTCLCRRPAEVTSWNRCEVTASEIVRGAAIRRIWTPSPWICWPACVLIVRTSRWFVIDGRIGGEADGRTVRPGGQRFPMSCATKSANVRARVRARGRPLAARATTPAGKRSWTSWKADACGDVQPCARAGDVASGRRPMAIAMTVAVRHKMAATSQAS